MPIYYVYYIYLKISHPSKIYLIQPSVPIQKLFNAYLTSIHTGPMIFIIDEK